MQSQRATSTRTAEVTGQRNVATSNPQLPTPALLNPVLQLQQTFGNQAVQRLLRSRVIQARLNISQPGDPFEQEADRVAEKVMRMPAPAVQRACAPCSSGGSSCPKCEAEKEKLVQRRVEHSTDNIGASVPDNFLQNLGPGQPLDVSTRAFFEPRFGHDFGGVRVHTSPRAAESASVVNHALATILAESGCTPARARQSRRAWSTPLRTQWVTKSCSAPDSMRRTAQASGHSWRTNSST